MFLEIPIIAALFVIVIYLWFKNREWRIRFEQKLLEWKRKEEETIRRDAIERSARTLSGKTLEKLVPFLDDFPYDAHDIRWLGDPIDLVIFDGQSSGNLNQIVFCEVKSGESKLTKAQNKIKELVLKKKVKWEEFKIEK
jgi:predicted Holliday junction resolvase-like endonuclease